MTSKMCAQWPGNADKLRSICALESSVGANTSIPARCRVHAGMLPFSTWLNRTMTFLDAACTETAEQLRCPLQEFAGECTQQLL